MIPHFSFGKLFKTINEFDFYGPDGRGNCLFKNSLSRLAFSRYYEKPNFNNTLAKLELQALKSLSKDVSIVITCPDKGNGVVLMNRTDYVAKIKTIPQDPSKFSEVDGDIFSTLLKNEDRVNRYLKQLLQENNIGGKVYRNLYSSGSRHGILYGLPKIHKENSPVRPSYIEFHRNFQL